MMTGMKFLLFCLAGALTLSLCAGESFSVDVSAMPALCVPSGVRPFVCKAAEDLATDMEKVFGRRPEITDSAKDRNAIVLGLDEGGFERYVLRSEAQNVLRITGSDDRGLMFGIYRFCSDFLEVDPFYYWSDFEPKRTARREWKDGIDLVQGEPAFKYRGWFINDEDFLNGFRKDENGTRKIAYEMYQTCFGPQLADRICEAAVRAGFNLIVSASYIDILNPDERRLVDVATARGLYVTMHHQEPVGAGAYALDVHFPELRETTYASHPDLWRKAWRAYVDEWAKVPDVIWQIGVRGRGDRPFWTVLKPGGSWSDWGVESEEENRRRAGLISQAMREQAQMIREATGGRPVRLATQLWMEGAEFYRKGLLDIPDGTIIMFSDNCPGLKMQPDIGAVRSLPDGGHYGLYYHLAVVLGNHYCELVPPSRTRQVLLDARGKGAQDLVLFNVSNVRPFLFTLAMAAEVARDGEAADSQAGCARWCVRRFGSRASDVARAIKLYFSAYETELSRDGSSSYGSARERAPLAIMNDGDLFNRLQQTMLPVVRRKKVEPRPVVSAYEKDPDRLTDISGKMHDRINQDMFPWLDDWSRYAARASAQAASFRRCLDQVALAARDLTPTQERQLFLRVGYPAGFMYHASSCLAEMTLAALAREEDNGEATIAHLEQALSHAQARDALDRRYNEGKWLHWYDRDRKYQYTLLSRDISEALRLVRERASAKRSPEEVSKALSKQLLSTQPESYNPKGSARD